MSFESVDLGYNYATFSFDQEGPELERWQNEGIQLGEKAPDFELGSPDGSTVQLSQLRGRPVVIEFGSYTCPIFCGRIEAMDELAQRFPEVAFLVVYVREAHPGEKIGPHRDEAEKRQAAQLLLREEAIRRVVLVDGVGGELHRAFGGAWNPVYVLDLEGRVVLRRAWNEPAEVAAALEELRRGKARPHQATEMGTPVRRRPMGLDLLRRGGRKALLDFYRSAPPPVREMLRNSPAPEVVEVVAAAS